jgi:hypothetical protein
MQAKITLMYVVLRGGTPISFISSNKSMALSKLWLRVHTDTNDENMGALGSSLYSFFILSYNSNALSTFPFLQA